MTTKQSKASDRSSVNLLTTDKNKYKYKKKSKTEGIYKATNSDTKFDSTLEYSENQENGTTRSVSKTSKSESTEASSSIAKSATFASKIQSGATKIQDVQNVGLQVEIKSNSDQKMEIESENSDTETHITDDIKYWCLHGQRMSTIPTENIVESKETTSFEHETFQDISAPEQMVDDPAKQVVVLCTGQCPSCNRSFDVQRLGAHINICEKVSGKKRCVFDSRQQRLKGTPGEYYVKTIERTMREPAKLCSNWKQAHKEFTQKVRTDRISNTHSPAQFAFVSEDLPHP